MTDIEILGLVGIVIAICEAIKRAGVNKRYIPLISIVLSISGALYFGGASWLMALVGLISGLTSSGIYDFGKKTVLGK